MKKDELGLRKPHYTGMMVGCSCLLYTSDARTKQRNTVIYEGPNCEERKSGPERANCLVGGRALYIMLEVVFSAYTLHRVNDVADCIRVVSEFPVEDSEGMRILKIFINPGISRSAANQISFRIEA